MTQNRRTYDPEKSDINVVRYKKDGRFFEVAVDPDRVFPYREGNCTLYEVLRSYRVFHKATEGREVFESSLEEVFNTTDKDEVIDVILRKGDVQLSPKKREELQRKKVEKLLDILTRNAVDPRTNTPHPRNRLEKILKNNVNIDEQRKAEDQVKKVVKQVKKHVPIDIETKEVTITTTAEDAYKIRNVLDSYGEIQEETWTDLFKADIKVPAGLYPEMIEKLNGATQGNIHIETNN